MTNHTKYLLVTCSLEETRASVAKKVIENLIQFKNVYGDNLTVFDNNSTIPWVKEFLLEHFNNVCISDINVGYWSAVDWWLENVEQDQFTYIIESDMIHYEMQKLDVCEKFLLTHHDVGSIRTKRYEVQNKHLYDKDNPHPNSIKSSWQSHTNRVTGEKISHHYDCDGIYVNNFLTQLPALNRTCSMLEIFRELRLFDSFSELDFQKKYWNHYKKTGLIDGGLYHDDFGSISSGVITGSWTNNEIQKKLGYKTTRFSQIIDLSRYNVTYTKRSNK